MTQPNLPYFDINPNLCDNSSGQRRLDALRDVVLPASHRDDPQSSKEAEERDTKSVERESHKLDLLRFLARNEGLMASEICACLGIYARWAWHDVVEVRRRLSDLRADGLADRPDRATKGEGEVRWSLTARGREVAG